MLISDSQVLHNCIGGRVSCASVDLEQAPAGSELHIEACACTLLHIELRGELVIIVLLGVGPRLQPENVIEGVLMPIIDKGAPVSHIRNTQQGLHSGL